MSNLRKLLASISPNEWMKELQGEWTEMPPTSAYPPKEHPYLVVAATYDQFRAWCEQQRLRGFGAQPQAVFVHRPEQLYGRRLLDDFVVLDYPVGERGRELHEEVERRLAIERLIRDRQQSS